MNLAKQALDVGLYTNQLDPMLAFWQNQAKVVFSEMLPVGSGVRQHRHAISESVLKINHQREPLNTNQPTGLSALTVHGAGKTQTLHDPDGNLVHLVAQQTATDPNLILHLATRDIRQQQHFYGEILGLEEAEAGLFNVGQSRIQLHQDSSAPEPGPGGFTRAATGFRYMTFQVFDVVGTHQQILAAGGVQGMAPIRLQDVAHISFVLDADGNWIEISQRKSITGSLD